MATQRKTAGEMATEIIARHERITLETVGDIAGAAIDALTIPPAAPFILVGAVALIPLRWVEAKLKSGSVPMPDEWYPSVLGTATEDGRFFVGRLLKNNGRTTIADAVRFLIIEREATPRAEYASEALEPANAKAELIAYYEANRTLFDKAVAATADVAVKAAGGAVGLAGDALKAAAQRIRRGF